MVAAVACAAAVTATTFTSSTFAATRAAAPVNTTPPTIDGAQYAGKTLTAGTGAWSNNPSTFTYKWIRCNNPTATRCNAIAGATARTYTLTQADVGHSIAVFVSASNSAGTAGPSSSKTTDLISAANAPAFRARPTVSGTPQVGEALVAKVGGFSAGIPHRIAFQWQSCDANGAGCKDIAGATGASYGVRSDDAGNTLRVKVTATNEFGSATSMSDRTAVVQKTAQVVTVTTSMTANRASTICCQTVTLTGTVSTQKAGESVVILAGEFGSAAMQPVANVTTDASGTWTALVRPHIQTTYHAQAGNTPSAGVTVNVRPRVGFGISGRLYTTRVTARDSFAGSIVLLQRRTGYRWTTLQRVVLNLESFARFSVRLPHGRSTLRVVAPAGSLGPGYLTGTSKSVTVHR
jgi:hypothetical protein